MCVDMHTSSISLLEIGSAGMAPRTLCVDMRSDVYLDMCIGMRTDMCEGVCIYVPICKRTGSKTGMPLCARASYWGPGARRKLRSKGAVDAVW